MVKKTKGGSTAPASLTTPYAPPADNAADWQTIICNAASYSGEIDTLRNAFPANRTAGVVWVKVTPVINGNAVLLCLDRKSLYLNAIRGRSNVWYYFDDAVGAIPTGATIASGGAHYSKLQPGKGPKTVQSINKVCAALVFWDGKTAADDIRRYIWLLVTLVSEACRFDSVRTAMVTYLEEMTFDLSSVEDTVKNWSSTSATNADAIVKYIE